MSAQSPQLGLDSQAWSVVRFPFPSVNLDLREEEVHVWRASLAPPARYVPALCSVLDSEERARADRFVFDRHRLRYMVAHGLLRHVLGGYLNLAPRAVRFVRAPGGKPYLASNPGRRSRPALRFNLAHSSDRALIAVSLGREVGVDLERVRGDRNVVGIARSFFSGTEAAALEALPEDEQVSAFYRCWTRKEAYVKACGAGLAMRLDSFAVSLEPGAPAALLGSGIEHELRRWQMLELAPGAGFDAALVVEGDEWRLVTNTLEFPDEAF